MKRVLVIGAFFATVVCGSHIADAGAAGATRQRGTRPERNANDMVTGEANRRRIEEWIGLFNRGDMASAAAFFAEDSLNNGRRVGRVDIRAVLNDIQTRFPDVKLTILNSVVEGDWVVVRCTYSGTHRGVGRLPVDGGMMVGVPATGRSFAVQHLHMFRLENGEIKEHWANRDDLGMIVQLGILPPPVPSAGR
jgi:steroid delta-isomerase-like uncharacterized protein